MFLKSSCLHRASTVSKHFLLFPTDAHNYKIIGMLKTIKTPIIAPICFGMCTARLHKRLVCHHNTDHIISDEHNRIIIEFSAKHEIAP